MAPATSSDAVTFSLDGDVAVITLDDGKVNVLTPEVVDALTAAVARARDEARAVALVGRPGRFCAGFDLTTMRSGPGPAQALLEAGARLALDLYLSPIPVVVGCTGHALAMGAILLLSADIRIGAEGPFKLGMNEVAIAMPMPPFAAVLGRDRLAPPHFTETLQLARIHDPPGAVAAGLLDDLCPAPTVAERAVGHAAELASRLDPGAFRATRATLRGAVHQRAASALKEGGDAFRIGQV